MYVCNIFGRIQGNHVLITWALGQFTVRRQAPDVRAGAGCPAAHEEPDVQASGQMSGLEWPILQLSG